MHVQLKSLTREDFQRILTQPDNALTLQYKALLAVDKVMLTFEDSAIEAIANAAFTANETAEDIGARACTLCSSRCWRTFPSTRVTRICRRLS